MSTERRDASREGNCVDSVAGAVAGGTCERSDPGTLGAAARYTYDGGQVAGRRRRAPTPPPPPSSPFARRNWTTMRSRLWRDRAFRGAPGRSSRSGSTTRGVSTLVWKAPPGDDVCVGSWEAYRVDDDGHYDVPDDLGGGLGRGVLGAAYEGLVLDGEKRGEDSEDEHGGYGHDDAAVDHRLVFPSCYAPAAAGAARGELVEGEGIGVSHTRTTPAWARREGASSLRLARCGRDKRCRRAFGDG